MMERIKINNIREAVETASRKINNTDNDNRDSRKSTGYSGTPLKFSEVTDLIKTGGNVKVNKQSAAKLKAVENNNNALKKRRVRTRAVTGGNVVTSRYVSGDPRCCRRRKKKRVRARVIDIYVDISVGHAVNTEKMKERGEIVLNTAKKHRMKGDIVNLHVISAVRKGAAGKRKIIEVDIPSRDTAALNIALAEPAFFRRIMFGVVENIHNTTKITGMKVVDGSEVAEELKKSEKSGYFFPAIIGNSEKVEPVEL